MDEIKNEKLEFLSNSADAIANFLKPYASRIEKIYDWSFDPQRVPDAINIDFDSLPNWYHKTIRLKERLVEVMNNTSSFDERYVYGEYFVVVWGKVATNRDLKGKLKTYDNVKDLSTLRSLNGVSSWSKYLSLRRPDAAIYDSRVAYSINTINYLNSNIDYFFPVPNGRSSKLGLLDIDTLFLSERLKADKEFITSGDLKHKQVANRARKKYHLPESITYQAYLVLIDMIADKLELTSDKKHIIEMLLFSLAPREIFEALVGKFKSNSR